MAALDMYAERGQWDKCLETAYNQVGAARPGTTFWLQHQLTSFSRLPELPGPP